jgi:hypothetical protein
MIIGIDHLAISCTNLDEEIERLSKKRFELQFIERNLINTADKKKLLNEYHDTHGMAYFKHQNGFKIEATQYGNQLYEPIGYFDVDLNDPKLISLKVNNLDSEVEFWTNGCGFKISELDVNEATLMLHSPFKEWSCSLKLFVTEEKLEPSYLDSKGFPCLAFISTNLHKDIQKIGKLGASTVIKPYELLVNKKKLLITMFRTPSSSIGELIQIIK